MTEYNKNAFCKGIGCHPQDRKFKCAECNKDICSTCTITENKKTYCVNCYILSFPKALNIALDNVSKSAQHKKHIDYNDNIEIFGNENNKNYYNFNDDKNRNGVQV